MDAKIDWLSFTLPVQTDNSSEENFHGAIEVSIKASIGEELANQVFSHHWLEASHGRAPYSTGWIVADTGISVYTSEKLSTLLVEVSGRGCDYLRANGLEGRLLSEVTERLSRLDIAADILTDTEPVDFVAQKTHRKERSTQTIQSDTGQTVYVGSRSSERYCRVYRYAEPHPRAKALRIEEVFRRKHARVIASQILDVGILPVARAVGDLRGWKHHCWGVSASDSTVISLPRPEREGHNTVRWLIVQAAPAFKRMVREGAIDDAQAFLASYFLPDDEKHA